MPLRLKAAEMVDYDARTGVIRQRDRIPLDDEDLMDLEDEAEVVTEVKGWGSYTHLLRWRDPWGGTSYYLAEVQ